MPVKCFYLAEFRGRSLALALPVDAPAPHSRLDTVMEELAANGTRCVLLAPADSKLAGIGGVSILQASEADWVARLWSAQQAGQRVALQLDPSRFAALRPSSRLQPPPLPPFPQHGQDRRWACAWARSDRS